MGLHHLYAGRSSEYLGFSLESQSHRWMSFVFCQSHISLFCTVTKNVCDYEGLLLGLKNSKLFKWHILLKLLCLWTNYQLNRWFFTFKWSHSLMILSLRPWNVSWKAFISVFFSLSQPSVILIVWWGFLPCDFCSLFWPHIVLQTEIWLQCLSVLRLTTKYLKTSFQLQEKLLSAPGK